MNQKIVALIALGACALLIVLGVCAQAPAQDPKAPGASVGSFGRQDARDVSRKPSLSAELKRQRRRKDKW